MHTTVSPQFSTGLATTGTVMAASDVTHPTWRNAVLAEQAGEFDRAEKLYLELAKDTARSGGSDALAEQCYAKVHQLREKRLKNSPIRKADLALANPRTLPVSTSTTATAPSQASDSEARWEGPGLLYASSLRVNNQKLYALQSTSQNVIVYVMPSTAIDLSPYVGKSIRLNGTAQPLTGYPGKNLMTPSRVELEN
jgi:hypothetical protein